MPPLRASGVAAINGCGPSPSRARPLTPPFLCRSRAPQDAQEKEFSRFVSGALSAAVRLDLFPKSSLDLLVTVLETGGTASALSAAITAASLAIADAGVDAYDLVAATSVAYSRGRAYLDATAREEACADGELVVARAPNLGLLTHVEYVGRVGADAVEHGVELCVEVTGRIHAAMVLALTQDAAPL